jgi:hypothetical protein
MTAFAATIIKFLLFGVASIGLLAALVCLACDQIERVWRGETGLLSVVALALTILLFFPSVKRALTKPRAASD